MKYVGRAASLAVCVGLVLAASHSEPSVVPNRSVQVGAATATSASPARSAMVRHASAGAAAAAGSDDYFLSPYTQFHPIEPSGENTMYAQYEAAVIGDVTGDGRDDVVSFVNAPSMRIDIFPQRADGKLDLQHPLRFDIPTPYGRADKLLLGDLNEDGTLDIVTAWPDGMYDGTLVVLLSNGQGGMTQTFVPTPFENLSNAFLLDVDLDGHLDLIGHETWPEKHGFAERVFFGDGTGALPRETVKLLPSGPGNGPLGRALDFNADGYIDILMAGGHSVRPDMGWGMVRRHNGVDGYSAAVPLIDMMYEFDFGDFNRDGRMDVVSGYQPYGLFTGMRLPNGKFEKLLPLPTRYMEPPGFIVADLDRDGADDLVSAQVYDFLFYPKELKSYLQRNGTLRLSETPLQVTTTNLGDSQQQLTTGDINGDGCTDIVQAAGPDGLLFFLGNNCRPARAARNDFDGDHASDVLWHNADMGTSDVWKRASRGQRKVVASISPAAWVMGTTGDFDGDGKSDILFRNRNTGANVVWRSGNSRTTMALRTLPGANWRIVGTGYFNADRKADLMWRNTVTGANVVWLSGNANTTMALRALPDQNWTVAGIGDFDGDGRDDVFWRHAKAGTNTVWRSGNAATTIGTTSLAPVWVAQGAGDFDGDGKADMLWRNPNSGVNVLWRSGSSKTSRARATVSGGNWSVAAIGDYDNDGKADIAWRHATSGTNVIWLTADGGRQRPVKAVDPAWKVVP